MGLDLESFLDEFRTEATHHLGVLNSQLLLLERNPDDLTPVRTMFLSAHTLKGAAAMMDLAAVEALAHAIEDVLAPLREQQQQLNSQTADCLFQAFDLLDERIQHDVPSGSPVDAAITAMVERLQRAIQPEDQATPPDLPPAAALSQASPRVLVVEASATVRLLHQAVLIRSGYTVDAVEDSAEGIALVAAQPYQLIVIGRELAEGPATDFLAIMQQYVAPERFPPIVITQSDEEIPTLPIPHGAFLTVAPLEQEGLTALAQQLLLV